MIKLLIPFFILFPAPLTAQAKSDERVEQLEAKVKSLTERLNALESNLQGMKKGGFTVVPVVNCQMKTSVGEVYEATELTKTAATLVVLDACTAKAVNKMLCNPNASPIICR